MRAGDERLLKVLRIVDRRSNEQIDRAVWFGAETIDVFGNDRRFAVGDGEVVAGAQRAGIVRAKQPTPAGQGPFIERDGFCQPPRFMVGRSKVAGGAHGAGVIGAKQAPPIGQPVTIVVEVLQKVLGCNQEKAFLLTHQAHTEGRAVVWTGPKEVAELKAEQIQSFPEIRADGTKFGPLGCTIEPAPG